MHLVEEEEEEKAKLLHAVTNLLPLGPPPAPTWEDRCHASRQSIQLIVGERTACNIGRLRVRAVVIVVA